MQSLTRREFAALPFGLDRVAMRVLNLYARLSLGVPLTAIAPREHIGAISPRPLLLIHGTSDQRVPVEQARRNFAAARAPKELWLVPRARHVEAHHLLGAAYERRVTRFLRRCLH
jgi:fermentation-respiration switch protein FrsA (DUF1100 family)